MTVGKQGWFGWLDGGREGRLVGREKQRWLAWRREGGREG
jgi:hypothetical protein